MTVTDPNAGNLGCTPANGSPLAPGASITCTADPHGHPGRHRCRPLPQHRLRRRRRGWCRPGRATTPTSRPTQNPHLTITKDATEASYDAVGDVIHYTIVATNDGNTTLAERDRHRRERDDLGCTPANGSSLAPGASITCTATHTVTQADIDAGHYLNTACVSATDATATCDDADVPSIKNPHLTIIKDATESSYDAVGDVIHYTHHRDQRWQHHADERDRHGSERGRP